jgi:hypothetical protein
LVSADADELTSQQNTLALMAAQVSGDDARCCTIADLSDGEIFWVLFGTSTGAFTLEDSDIPSIVGEGGTLEVHQEQEDTEQEAAKREA